MTHPEFRVPSYENGSRRFLSRECLRREHSQFDLANVVDLKGRGTITESERCGWIDPACMPSTTSLCSINMNQSSIQVDVSRSESSL